MHQKSKFEEWYPKVRNQPGRCKWDDYNTDITARDAILIQTSNIKIQKKIITEDLKYMGVINFSLAMKHSDRKMKELGKNQGEEEG